MRSTAAEQHLDAPLPASLPSALDEARDHSRGAAYHLLPRGRLADAEGLSKGLLDARRRDANAHSRHAAVLLAEGRLADALAHASRGLRQDPGNPKLLDLRARILVAAADDRRYGDRTASERDEQSSGVDCLATRPRPGDLVASLLRPPAAPGPLAISGPTATHPTPLASARRVPIQTFVETIAQRGSRGTRGSELESAAPPRRTILPVDALPPRPASEGPPALRRARDTFRREQSRPGQEGRGAAPIPSTEPA